MATVVPEPVAPELMNRVRQHMRGLRPPTASDRVHKDECVLSFDSPLSPDGLYVNLSTFKAYGQPFVLLDHQKTGNVLYLHLKKVLVPKPAEEMSGVIPPEKRPRQLAIGVEGGFSVDDKPNFVEHHALVLLPDFVRIPMPNPELPELVQIVVQAILTAPSASRTDDILAWTAEPRPVSKVAESLVQLDNGVKVPPSGWQCSKCDLKENLWLNLTDGTILCGRRNFDGSGGNGHALEHYKATGYPLCVKLGTITAEGEADVYSYAEDDLVIDPHLTKHLEHFGINVKAMKKTDKTMAEMEIDQNLTYEFSRLQESGKTLQPLHGPGYTGLQNLGNTCYMASVVQVLFSLPPFIEAYFENGPRILENAPNDPDADLTVQLAKMATGLLSGRYSSPLSRDATTNGVDGIPPRSLKALVGKGHPEFSTMRQQDAVEFFQYLMTAIERKERASGRTARDPSAAFKFRVESRVQCGVTGKVAYHQHVDSLLPLTIPLERATNLAEVAVYEDAKRAVEAAGGKWDGDKVRPIVPLAACFEAFAESETVPDFFSTATGQRGPASKTTRLATFPPYLLLQIRRFGVNPDWTPKKLDVHLQVDDELDLSGLRAKGLQPGEELLPEGAPAAAARVAPAAPAFDEAVLNELVSMGFNANGCRRAVYATAGQGLEAAMNWVLEHMSDADFDTPYEPPQLAGTKGAASVHAAPSLGQVSFADEVVEAITAMGFTRPQAVKALKATGGNVERAADWIFSHMDELDAPEAPEATSSEVAAPAASETLSDGTGRYRLVAFVSHMGTSTSSGHYVAHIRKQGRWVLYNDTKVALSEDPPKDMGYLYVYAREDVQTV